METLGKRRKWQEIAEHLELSIISRRYQVGDRIPSERDLMDRFQAGRSSVREALFSLQRKGLLTVKGGAVPRVSEPTADLMVEELSGIARMLLMRPDGVRDLQQARLLFEAGLARHAARGATGADVDRLRDALRENEDATDAEGFVTTDIAFHATIASVGSNSIYPAVSTAFAHWLREQRTTSARAGVTRETAIVQHRAVFEAIAARDHRAAEDAMEAHLKTVADYYWRIASPVA